MPRGPKLALLTLTDEQRDQLNGIAHSTTMPHALVQRARMILASAEGLTNAAVARRVGVTPHTVSKWRRRFREAGIQGLHDELRPGRPRTYDDDKVAAVINRALQETPDAATHWSTRTLGRTEGIGKSTVPVAHHNTVFVQLLRFLPRHEFEAEARQHQRGQGLRVMSRWAQFVALGLAQLTGRQSLRDIVSNLSTQGRKLYHLGVGTTVSRSSLARVNAEQPYTLYETLFGRLLSRCQQCAPRHGFRFKNKLYAVDATTIDLCLAVFPWASFRRTKAAIKLHIGLDQAGHLPSFVSVTEGKTGDVKAARTWTFPAGSVVVADRAYLDFKWFHQLQARGVTFVTRLKRGVRYRVTREHDIRPGTGVLSDQTIELTSARSRKAYAAPLRRVAYQDPVTKNRYVFVTNNTTWVAQTIADIYKSRWQIELFFKWIKQHLKVKRFVGRSKNAVMTQLWVAMCMYLLLAYLKFVMRLRWSLHQMLQVLQLNMFERRPLQDLFTTPSLPAPSGSQLSLAWS